MKSSNGQVLTYTLFGESHSKAIGITVSGLPCGVSFDFTLVDEQLALRSGNSTFNTPRKEKIEYDIICGYFDNKTTGTPLTVLFYNQNTRSKDYRNLVSQPRPGHADYVANLKYNGAQDYRGGGHFSGRLTTPIVFLGALTTQLLQVACPGMEIITHISQFSGINDTNYYDLRKELVAGLVPALSPTIDLQAALRLEVEPLTHGLQQGLEAIKQKLSAIKPSFPLINQEVESLMLTAANQARSQHDSLGGVLETVIINPPIAIGEPFFHSVESVLAGQLFSIGTVKAVEFGHGTLFGTAFGSAVKDEFIAPGLTLFNYNGGLNGGISNGEDIIIKTTLKPIASIMQKQHTLNFETDVISPLQIKGRHDATIINRVIPAINAVISIALYDLYLQQATHTSVNYHE
ncbi:MAG: chorismate synthase [Culicoidibacterales bacterium]